MQSNFHVNHANQVSQEERFLVRLRQRSQALRTIQETGECPGIVPWPLNQELEGRGPNPSLCQCCDLYVSCPILDKLVKAAPVGDLHK